MEEYAFCHLCPEGRTIYNVKANQLTEFERHIRKYHKDDIEPIIEAS